MQTTHGADASLAKLLVAATLLAALVLLGARDSRVGSADAPPAQVLAQR